MSSRSAKERIQDILNAIYSAIADLVGCGSIA